MWSVVSGCMVQDVEEKDKEVEGMEGEEQLE